MNYMQRVSPVNWLAGFLSRYNLVGPKKNCRGDMKGIHRGEGVGLNTLVTAMIAEGLGQRRSLGHSKDRRGS